MSRAPRTITLTEAETLALRRVATKAWGLTLPASTRAALDADLAVLWPTLFGATIEGRPIR
jgi:hypothetical protein